MCFVHFRSLANTLRVPERAEDFHWGVVELSFTPEQNNPDQSHCLSHHKVKSILRTEQDNYTYALCFKQQRRLC